MALEALVERHGIPGQVKRWGTAAPSASGDGTFKVGDIVWNTVPAAGGASYVGWVCTTAGTPGTFKGFGLIEA